MTYEMNGLLSGLDHNSAGTGVVLFGIGYFVGSILISRIYISGFKNGDTTYIDSNGERKKMPRFGTSGTGRVHGKKVALPHFIGDVAKSGVGYGAIVGPLQMYVPEFVTSITIFYGIGVMVGNNGPIGGKFEGGVGAALAFGMVLSMNGFLGVLGFATYILLLKTTKQTAFSAMLAGMTSFILLAVPAIQNQDGMGYPALKQLDHTALMLTTGASAAYSLGIMFAIMMIKRRTALKGFAKLTKKFFTGSIKSEKSVADDRFSSIDDVK